MPNGFIRLLQTRKFPSYVIFFVTARCNASCKMCFYETQITGSRGSDKELTLDEYRKISENIKHINILGISGGEPFLRDDLAEIVKTLYRNCSPLVLDLPTNGYFPEKIAEQVEDILSYCGKMNVDIQLSIDGPEKIHNEIRGLKNGFSKIKETYQNLVPLKKKYKNLNVKACVVYSHYNQDHIEELFEILKTDFKQLDRTVFSVVHGSVNNREAFQFNWEKYFEICDSIRRTAAVKGIGDFHSIFTMALRIVKNDYLKGVLSEKNYYKKCGAGKRVVAIDEKGQVFPCEPLWHSVGDLRENNYDLNEILQSNAMKEFNNKISSEKCTCHWGLPMSNNLVFNPAYYPQVLLEMCKIASRSFLTGKN